MMKTNRRICGNAWKRSTGPRNSPWIGVRCEPSAFTKNAAITIPTIQSNARIFRTRPRRNRVHGSILSDARSRPQKVVHHV